MNDEKENIAENSNIGESAAPKRKPVIRKVSAAPTKFAPIRPKEENAAPPAPLIPFDEDFSEDDDAAAYAAAATLNAPRWNALPFLPAVPADSAPSRKRISPAKMPSNPKSSSAAKTIP